MLRARHVFCGQFSVAFAGLVLLCGLAVAAFGQTTSAVLSQCSAYASVPLPAEADTAAVPTTPPACASYRSYRGIGRPVNYSEARACAWKERLAQKADLGQNEQEPIAWVVGGSLILADIYFNGSGVKANIPLAMRLACESEEGMVKVAAPDVAKLGVSRPVHGRFEFCEYALSTFMMNFCAAYASQIEDEHRSRYFDSLKSSMTPQERTAFERLLSAQDAYVEAHASEVDQGGTIRGVRTIGSKAILKDLFQMDVVNFERKKWPALSDKEIRLAEAWLHREYENKLRQLRTRTKEEIELGTVAAEQLAGVERTWQTYRDAWVAFARLRYPSAVDVIRSKVTLERYRLLKTIG
jgi:hypothetical protein